MKFINNRYVTPVTIEFGSSILDNSVNLPVKHHKLFATRKLLDPFISITINHITINHPGEFPMGTTYIEKFKVITDKNPPRARTSLSTTNCNVLVGKHPLNLLQNDMDIIQYFHIIN